MPVCAVKTCLSSAEDTDGLPKNLNFHRFPKNEDDKKKWIVMTGRENWTPDDNSYVCSRHFRDTDYIIKRSGNRYLKITAIPCEYVVYNLGPDEEPTPAAETNDDREATPATSPAPATSSTPNLEADSTSNYDDYNQNYLNYHDIGWDQFENMRHFEEPEPAPPNKRPSSTEGSPVKRKRGKKLKGKKRRHRRHRSPPMEDFKPQMKEEPYSEMEDLPPQMKEEPYSEMEDLPPQMEEELHSEMEDLPPQMKEELHSEMEDLPPQMEEELHSEMEDLKPQMEEQVKCPLEEILPLIEEAQPPNEDIPLAFEEVDFSVDEFEFPLEEVRLPTPEVRPPTDPNNQLNQIKMLLDNWRNSGRRTSTPMPEINLVYLNQIDKFETIINDQNNHIIMLSSEHRSLIKILKKIAAIVENVE